MLTWLLLVACTPEPAETADTAPPPEETDAGGCDVVELRWDGPDEPLVGDTWAVSLYCDDALMLGANVLQVDPVDFATIEENVLTFVVAGTGIVRMQSGSYREEVTVTVSEP
jgi:hypothetical protein